MIELKLCTVQVFEIVLLRPERILVDEGIQAGEIGNRSSVQFSICNHFEMEMD